MTGSFFSGFGGFKLAIPEPAVKGKQANKPSHLVVRWKKDFAFLLPSDKSVQNLLDVIKNTDELVGQVNVFDLYSEEHVNKDVSVGVEVEIIQKNKVFNSEEISYIMDKIIKNVEKKLDAKLRKS